MQSITVGLLVYLVGAMVTSAAQSPSQDELMRRLKLNQALYQSHDYGESLAVRVDRTGADVIKNLTATEDIMQCVSNCEPAILNDNAAIKSATRFSDITVIGHIAQGRCGMTKRGAFLYTDWEMVVDEVLFQKPISASRPQIHEGDEITVTEPGGKIKYGDHTIEVNAPGRKRLAKGRSYLLFLQYLPESQSYKTIGLDGYDVSDSAVLSLHPTIEPIDSGALADRSSFLTGVRHSVINAQAGGVR